MTKKRERQSAQRSPNQLADFGSFWVYLVMAAAIAVFVFTCFHFELTQDDAYISFRYAENLINGDGLVFNIGERVEGYTNFLWVILLALAKGLLGVDYLATSRVLGVAAGASLFVLLFMLVRLHYEGKVTLIYFGLAAAMLSNLAIAYWSIASLETAAFACMALGAIVAEYSNRRLTPALLVIATLLRPEGAVVFGVILIHRIITDRRFPAEYFLVYLAPLVPFAVFKLSYYGSLFPNPYYAKSGVGLEYIASGLEYLWYFTQTIGLYGLVFLAPLLAIKKLWRHFSLLYLYVLIYIAYIVWVGGDVLKVYRFFVPVIPVLYFLFVASLFVLGESLIKDVKRAAAIVLLVCFGFSFGSWSLSKDHVETFWFFEQNIVRKMHFMGTMLKKYMGTDFSLAASTIGMISYQLMGHRVIDMLGLTDSYIARNPEKIEGITSTWKERRFNNEYLLSQEPDFILFSTGYKPSAPAERALMLHSEFRHKYTTTGFLRERQYKVIWRRTGKVDMAQDVVHPNVDFVQKLSDSFYHSNRSSPDVALQYFRETKAILGEEFPLLDYSIGDCFSRMRQTDSAMYYFNKAADADTNSYEPRIRLIRAASERKDTTTVRIMATRLS
ncbi:MAG: hypothetical protein WBP42_08480 [Candidatus Zixiibacteriota bacterium]